MIKQQSVKHLENSPTFLCLVRSRNATRLVLIRADDWIHAEITNTMQINNKHKVHFMFLHIKTLLLTYQDLLN